MKNDKTIAPELTIALAKGRMQSDSLKLLESVGIAIDPRALASRRLAIEDTSHRFRFIFVKPTDVPVYVEHGVADCGICGGDVLREQSADVLEPLDLRIARCRIVVAAPASETLNRYRLLRVATKYPQIAMRHFGERGVPVEIIELAGSVELAPVLGLADCIVDLVETGRTLIENNLAIVEEVAASSGRLIVNRASYQLKAGAIAELIDKLSVSVEEGVVV